MIQIQHLSDIINYVFPLLYSIHDSLIIQLNRHCFSADIPDYNDKNGGPNKNIGYCTTHHQVYVKEMGMGSETGVIPS